MLYLVKGSRVREYRRQNIDVLSAPEKSPFVVTYGARWIADGVEIAPGSSSVLVFADSPYERFVPVRFFTIDDVEIADGRTRLAGRLGAFVCAQDREVLSRTWSAIDPSDPNKPGRHRFVVTDAAHGIYAPQSPRAHLDAWRQAVADLASNPFFEDTTILRLASASVAGREIDAHDRVNVGDTVRLNIEALTPASGIDGRGPSDVDSAADAPGNEPGDKPGLEPGNKRDEASGDATVPGAPRFAPTLLSDPSGAARLASTEPAISIPAHGFATIDVDIVEPGPLLLQLGIAGRTLTSTWLTLPLEVAGSHRAPGASHVHGADGVDGVDGVRGHNDGTGSGGEPVDVASLARYLTRHADLSASEMLILLDDFLLPSAPGNTTLLGLAAAAAADRDEWDRVIRSLTAIDERTPDQQNLLLRACVLEGRNDLVHSVIDETDLTNGDNFERLLHAVADAPPATAQLVLTHELEHRMLGDERRADLVSAAWRLLHSDDVRCAAAEDVAYVNPEAGARLLFDRWDKAEHMPDKPLELLLDWGVLPHRLAPYVRERLRRAALEGDPNGIDLALSRLDSIGVAHRPLVQLEAAQALFRVRDTAARGRAVELCVTAAHAALDAGELDVAIEAARALRTSLARAGKADLALVEETDRLVEQAVESSAVFIDWQRMRAETRAEQLRHLTTGKRLFCVGGGELPDFDDIAEQLGLAHHRWIEISHDKGTNHDWADGIRTDDIVIAVLPWIGHSDTAVKDKVVRKGGRFAIVRRNLNDLLNGIERALRTDTAASD